MIIPPKPEYNRVEIPNDFRKGEDFENFVVQTLFPPALYTIVRRFSGSQQLVQPSGKNSLQPGFLLRDHNTGTEFFIGCKHHYSLIANSFQFTKTSKTEAYHASQDHPFFLVLGLGGTCDKPNEVYLTNLKDCPYQHLFKRHLRNKAIVANTPLSSAELWKYESSLELPDKKIA